MNLLTDKWLPVRPLQGAATKWIGLSELLTEDKEYEICLPRDDLEMAALQLVICITQVLFTPDNTEELIGNIRNPMNVQSYLEKIEPFKTWFELEHPKHPFMQVRGVQANKKTPMGRLLPGLADATNSCFVNENGIAKYLCEGCAAIAVFNRASNSPSFGGGALGGFKPGLRGSIPITTLIQGSHLREMVWLNILSSEFLMSYVGHDSVAQNERPSWVSAIKKGSKIEAHTVGLLRGLLWQPALIELGPPIEEKACDLCGRRNTTVFDHFITNQFGYTLSGTWPHPHSPIYMEFKSNNINKTFASFKNSAPSWTQLGRFVVKQSVDDLTRMGQEPAAVLSQAKELFGRNKDRITLSIGGYRNEPGKTASIAERKHETITINRGWNISPQSVSEIVQIGLGYKSALFSALRIFDEGIKDKKLKRKTHKGLGFSKKKKKYPQIGETIFYRRTDNLMQKAIAGAHFESPEQLVKDKKQLRSELRRHCIGIFEEQTRPYLNDPELIRTMAVARRTLYKHLKTLEPETEGGEK